MVKKTKNILKDYRVLSFLMLIFVFIGVLIFLTPKKSSLYEIIIRRDYVSEECYQVDFEVEKLTCENKVIKAWIKNVGKIGMKGDFLAIVYTPHLQALLGGEAEKTIEPNETALVLFDFGKSDIIKRIEIVFQPCPFSTKVLENLNIKC